jgi:hypothetical protein
MPTPVNLTLTLRRIVQGKNPREYFDPDEMAVLEKVCAERAGLSSRSSCDRPRESTCMRSWPASADGARARTSSATTRACPW